MPNLLRITAIGHLGRDPELRSLPDGEPVVNFRMAVTDKSSRGETTIWLNVAAFGKTGQVAMKYLRKGDAVYVEGRFRLREWTDSEGARRVSPDVMADRIVLLGGEKNHESAAAAMILRRSPSARKFHDPAIADVPTSAREQPRRAESLEDIGCDIPF